MCSISWLNFLKFVRFSSRVKRKTVKLHKNVTYPATEKVIWWPLLISLSYDSKFEICTANYLYPGKDHETWFELSKFLSYPRSSYPSFTVTK